MKGITRKIVMVIRTATMLYGEVHRTAVVWPYRCPGMWGGVLVARVVSTCPALAVLDLRKPTAPTR